MHIETGRHQWGGVVLDIHL